MVVPPLELCFELGYQEGIEYLPSRGPPKLLLDDLKAFVQEKSSSESVESLSAAYLAAEPTGLKHEPPKTACQLAEMLSWPKHQLIITDLLSQLLAYVMESHAPQTQIVDLTGDGMAEAEEAGVPVSGHYDQNRIESGPSHVSISQNAGPITRLHLRDPAMISSLRIAGFPEPFPVTTSNEKDLVQILERWISSHPDRRPPASKPLNKQICGHRFRYAKELTFGSTSEPVWVERVRISAHHMAFFLKEDDGSCMLVDANYANNQGWRGYHGWLGAGLGFTRQTIAQTGSEVELQELDEEAESSDETVYKHPETTGAERQDTVKKEPSLASARQTTIRRNQLERQTDEERRRYETPPLSSMDVVKKRRWPAQYVSPPPTPQSQKDLQGRKKILKAPKPVPQDLRYQRCSGQGLTSVGLALAKPENAQSRILDGNDIGKSRGRPRKIARKNLADTPQMLVSPVSPVDPISSAAINRAIPEPVLKPNIILHFFLQRRELGALPTPLAQCDAADKFFDHADEAWGFLSSGTGTSAIVATSVEVEGVEWPMIIPWRDSLAHQWMMETIAKAAVGRSYDLHVKVKCITK